MIEKKKKKTLYQRTQLLASHQIEKYVERLREYINNPPKFTENHENESRRGLLQFIIGLILEPKPPHLSPPPHPPKKIKNLNIEI